MAVNYTDIGLAEPSTITNRVGTVTITRNSTAMQQEILTLGDPQTSNALARITDTTPDSTMFGVVVREAVPQSTVMAVSSISGKVLVEQNSTVWQVQVGGYVAPSTTVTVSGTVSVTGYVAPSTVVTVSTGSVRVHQSSAADLNVTVSGYVAPSTTVSVSTGSVRVHQSSAADLNVTVAGYVAPSTTITVAAMPTYDSTFVSGSKGTSGDTTLISSAASTRYAVFGYALSIDSTTPTIVRLLSGSTTEMARWIFRAPSSVTIGANAYVEMPGYLYQAAAGNALVLNTDSTATVHYTFSAYRKS